MEKHNPTNGKLVVKTFINHHAADEHGRTGGRWATLFTKHGVMKHEAGLQALAFKENNPHILTTFGRVDCVWIAYQQHIYID